MELVTVKTFDNYFSANILLSQLQQAGIPCFLKDEHMVTMLCNAVGGIKLVINKSDEALARNILKELDEDFKKTVACPRCGGYDIELIPPKNDENIFTSILTWFFSNDSDENIYRCSACGYESATLPENTAAYN